MSDTVITALIAAGIPAMVSVISAVIQYRSKYLTEAMKENCSHMDKRFDELRKEMEEGQKKDEQAIMRLELMTLMKNDPENVLEIEKLARKYFDPNGLNGNAYMTGIVSRWCKSHNIEPTGIIGKLA